MVPAQSNSGGAATFRWGLFWPIFHAPGMGEGK
jgi:hypothetical protein